MSPIDAGPEWHDPWTRESGNARAARAFRDAFDAEPAGVWSAPGRVNLIGEHTDYNGGLCLPSTLRHRTYVAASPRDDGVIEIFSTMGSELEGPGDRWRCLLDDISSTTATGWPAYAGGVVWALRERGYDGCGLNLAIASCTPIGAGLGSSAALTCSTALAVNALWRLALDAPDLRTELAEAAIDAENRVARTPTGGLDQYASLFCHDGSAVDLDFATTPPSVRDTPLYFPDYGLALLIIDTRTRHHLTDGHYAERFEECKAAAAALGARNLRAVADDPLGSRRIEVLDDEVLKRRARHVVSEIERVRLVASELAGTAPAHERFIEIGRHIYRSHTSLAVDFEVSSPELDLAVNASWTAGALGARLVGAGFGGSAIALIRRSQIDAAAVTIDQAFADGGFERPRFLRLQRGDPSA